jgi:hypothetical protein
MLFESNTYFAGAFHYLSVGFCSSSLDATRPLVTSAAETLAGTLMPVTAIFRLNIILLEGPNRVMIETFYWNYLNSFLKSSRVNGQS